MNNAKKVEKLLIPCESGANEIFLGVRNLLINFFYLDYSFNLSRSFDKV